jgi:DNA-binding MarR family transcriptional regulator
MLRYYQAEKRGAGLSTARSKKTYNLTLQELGREMSVHTIMFHSAVAERLGLSASDHRCFDYILRMNGVTAGQLSKFTGLTSGAITGVIDRLEKAGFAKRQPDSHDRRKVIIVPLPDRLPEMGKLFESLSRNMAATMAHFSEKESAVLVDFMQRAINVMQEENLKLRAQRHTNQNSRQ